MTTIRERIRQEIEDSRGDPDFELATLLLDVTEQITVLMEERGMSRAELARELGVAPALITRLMRGEDNTTLRTLVRVATALNADITLRVRPRPQAKTSRSPRRVAVRRAG